MKIGRSSDVFESNADDSRDVLGIGRGRALGASAPSRSKPGRPRVSGRPVRVQRSSLGKLGKRRDDGWREGANGATAFVTISSRNKHNMAEGTIKRLTDRGFGFIETSPGNDIFFHMSNVDGVRFEDLREGQKVSFDEGQGPKGPRAENVRPL